MDEDARFAALKQIETWFEAVEHLQELVPGAFVAHEMVVGNWTQHAFVSAADFKYELRTR